MVATTGTTSIQRDNRPFQTVGRSSRTFVENGPQQEHLIPLTEFVPGTLQGKDQEMFLSAVSQLFKIYGKMIQRCTKLVVSKGTVLVKGCYNKKDIKTLLSKLCMSKYVKLPERQCYALMNNQNLVDFTRDTGAFAICRPKQETVLVLGPCDRVKNAAKYIITNFATSEPNHRSDRRIMKIAVIARQHILDNRSSLVDKGHIWIDRASEKDGSQELHIVGYPRDFDFDAAECAIRNCEAEFIEQISKNSPNPQPDSQPGSVVVSGAAAPIGQFRKHRDSSKLLIADPPEEANSSGSSSAKNNQPAVKKPPQVPVPHQFSTPPSASTVDFPYLTNPLRSSVAAFAKYRDTNNIWMARVPSSGVSTGSTLFAYHSSISSNNGEDMLEDDSDLSPSAWIGDDWGPDKEDVNEVSPSSSSASRLLRQLHSATYSAGGAPLTVTEKGMLKDICQAAGILDKATPSPPLSPTIAVLVTYNGPITKLIGYHTLKLTGGLPFSSIKQEVCENLHLPVSDCSFLRQDPEFDVSVNVSDDEIIADKTRLILRHEEKG
eukprot:TRINITY_DN11288_c0_g1_i1.p1 TRINITY_DN11288_c0_g1~~TRINITY_DN11288_c0_g1_i1.p1  ORF type:complete len:547 (+),score=97.15 TRINITY_DN11288_c0_g1_i1:76-1716(+)